MTGSVFKVLFTWVGVIALAFFVGTHLFSTVYLGLIVYGIFLLLLIGLTRLDLGRLAVAFVAVNILAQLGKRAICLVTGSVLPYYGMLFVPGLVLAVVLVVTCSTLRGKRLPASARALKVFIGLALAMTLVSKAYYSVPWFQRFSAVFQAILPMTLFFAGIPLGMDCVKELVRIMLWLAILSVAYALVQFFMGPTPLDVAWATSTYTHSLQGWKVLGYLEGKVPVFTGYSFFSDPLSWGLFLNAGLVVTLMAKEIGFVKKRLVVFLQVLVLAGLFVTLSRSPWLCLFSIWIVFWLLRRGSIRRPMPVFLVILALFPLVIILSAELIRRYAAAVGQIGNLLLRRYATIGTLGDRVYSLSTIRLLLVRNWLWGNGYAYSALYAGDASRAMEAARVHNFMTGLVCYTGLPGLIAFLIFYCNWLREMLAALRHAQDQRTCRLLMWGIALSMGFLMTGYFSGPNFMNAEFFLLSGMFCGFAKRVLGAGDGVGSIAGVDHDCEAMGAQVGLPPVLDK